MIYDRNADTQSRSKELITMFSDESPYTPLYPSAWDLFKQYPDLEKMYYDNPIINAAIRVLRRVSTKEEVLDLIHQLLVQNNNLQERLTDAVKQGYYPKSK
jgi:hypothetical protein